MTNQEYDYDNKLIELKRNDCLMNRVKTKVYTELKNEVTSLLHKVFREDGKQRG